MALAQCTVSGVIQLPDTTIPIYGAKLVFILSNVEEETEIIAPIRVEATVNTSTGAFSVDLWPNALGTTESAYYVTLERFGATAARPVAPISLGTIYVPDSASAAFSALIQTPPFTPPSASILVLADAARDAAAASAIEASGFADDASASATTAGVSASAASDAQTAAEAAQTAIESSSAFVSILYESWVELIAATGTGDGQRASVGDADAGTHSAASATGYDGATVDNAGEYRWDTAWSRWIRVGDNILQSGAEIKAAYEGEADTNAFTDSEKTNVANLVTDTGTPDVLARIRVDDTAQDFMRFRADGAVDLLDGRFRRTVSDQFFDVTDESKTRLFSVSATAVELMGGEVAQPSCDDIFNIKDASGRKVFLINRSGEVGFIPQNIPASVVIDLGATGPIANVQRVSSTLLRYTGNAMGWPANYLVGTVLDDPAHVYAGDYEMEVHLDYGQSWRADLLDPDFDDLDGKSLPTVYALRDEFGALYTSYRATLADDVIDLARVGPELANTTLNYDFDNRGGVSIGRVSALVYQHFCKDENQHIRGVITVGGPRPGSWWSEDGNTGSTDDWLAPGSPAWTAQTTILSKVEDVLPQYNLAPKFAALGWTHGAPSDASVVSAGATYLEELEEMMAAYDALNLRGGPMRIYSDQTPATSTESTCRDSMLDQVTFAANNSGRVHLIGPRYPYAFKGDNIHHNALATTQIGELEGYVKYKTLRKGEAWVPLKITAAEIAGAVVTLTLSDPFGSGVLAEDTTQIEAADDKGFRVKVNAVTATISSIVITGLEVAITLSATPTGGDSIEVSYAWYRTAAVADDGTRSGVWGNVKQVGPASKIFDGATIDTWLCSHKETITA